MPHETTGDGVQRALHSQGMLLGQHDQHIRSLLDNNQRLLDQVSQLTSQVANLVTLTTLPPSASPPPVPPTVAPGSAAAPALREPPTTSPEPFTGELNKCRGFLLQCRLVFQQKPLSFSTESSKVHYALGLLRGKALIWAEAACSTQQIASLSFDDFSSQLEIVFDHPDHAGTATKRLLKLRQGTGSVAEYAIDFWTLAADSKWNDEALQGAFVNGLSDTIKDELAVRDEPANLHSLVSLATRIDSRLRERRQERGGRVRTAGGAPSLSATRATPPLGHRPHTSAVPTTELDEPMQLGRARLSPAEKERRMRAGECMYCGDRTHFLVNCPVRPKDKARR